MSNQLSVNKYTYPNVSSGQEVFIDHTENPV